MIVIILFCMMLLAFYITFKNKRTLVVRLQLNDAVHDYLIDCLYKDKEPLVGFEDLNKVSYEKTLFGRFWDWSNKNILPKEKYEIIKPFIKEQ